jgi:hypothetical protein
VVLDTLIKDAALLFSSLLVTLRITVLSLALAVSAVSDCRCCSPSLALSR